MSVTNDKPDLSGLRAYLEADGFRFQANRFRDELNQCDWLAYRPTKLGATPCECNENKRKQMEVHPWVSDRLPNGAYAHGVTMKCTGEAGGMWFELSAYGMSLDEFPRRAKEAEAALVTAWNALPRVVPEE
jgi:hypothetical protein